MHRMALLNCFTISLTDSRSSRHFLFNSRENSSPSMLADGTLAKLPKQFEFMIFGRSYHTDVSLRVHFPHQFGFNKRYEAIKNEVKHHRVQLSPSLNWVGGFVGGISDSGRVHGKMRASQTWREETRKCPFPRKRRVKISQCSRLRLTDRRFA